jgi:hypothetical protein
MARRNYNSDPSDRVRCIDGRLMRHDPQPDDPYLETDVGKCDACGGKGCVECQDCGEINCQINHGGNDDES